MPSAAKGSGCATEDTAIYRGQRDGQEPDAGASSLTRAPARGRRAGLAGEPTAAALAAGAGGVPPVGRPAGGGGPAAQPPPSRGAARAPPPPPLGTAPRC